MNFESTKVFLCENARTNTIVSLATVNNISLKGANATVKWREVAVAVSASHTLTIDYPYMKFSLLLSVSI
tara:strand:+ start:3591 stop:3800 length:210 start_codon:yes stop_codon:yes gene_type:complete